MNRTWHSALDLRRIAPNLERRPDHSVNWPRAVQSSIAILGACAFGVLSYGYGYGVSSGRTESYPQSAMINDTTYPNRPAGLTLYTRWDGTTKTPPAEWGAWERDSITVVNDPEKPWGAGDVLRFHWLAEIGRAHV